MKSTAKKSLIIFDGICNLCNSSARFVLKHDKKHTFVFAILQSDVARDILLQFPKKITKKDSIILIKERIIYTESTAVLLILKEFDGLWKLLLIFWIIPKFARDSIYRFIAKHRYRWFGRRIHCALPEPKDRERFI